MFHNLSVEEDRLWQLKMDSILLTQHVMLYINCSFGVPANILCFIILSTPQMKSPINCYLKFMAVFDGSFLLCWILFMNDVGIPWVYIMMYIVATGSVYSTIGISSERFVAVCYPLKAKHVFTYKRTLLYNLMITVFAILWNVPRLYLSHESRDGSMELVLYYNVRYGSQADSYFSDTLKSDLHLVKCYVWIEIVVMYLVPQLTIASLNICIYREVRRARRIRQEMSQSQQHEINLSKTVFCIIAIFFSCWTPVLIFKVASYRGILPLYLYYCIYLFCYPVLTLNSTVNVIIYTVLRRDFRNTLLAMFRKGNTMSSGSNVTSTAM